MKTFLLIETATVSCSVAAANEKGILASKEISIPKAHASSLCPMIEDVLQESGIKVADLSAVAVSKGPGSYTGLRVGVSTAKGLCFGAGVPLIGIGTLDILAEAGRRHLRGDGIIIPMIDARRMEVYTALFDSKANRMSEVQAMVLDGDSFEGEFEKYEETVFIGDGAEKFKSCLNEGQRAKSQFIQRYPSAEYMLNPALRMWEKKIFEDVAYFEPFYLKDFVAGISKKSRKALYE